ncbi:transposase [Streptococcus pseudopneumoniae]|uniref:transposase n=1 Tax=Streptococcus pseudopneumoniae TaxID=257758 RepID=UPI002175B22D|nr:transposase [Streptococcus pseudopneumoniae]
MKIIQQQSATIDSLTNELALLREQVAYLTQKLYGKSPEKSVCPSGRRWRCSQLKQRKLPTNVKNLKGNAKLFLPNLIQKKFIIK